MNAEFISVKDRIISASIELISDGGLELLTAKNISMRTRIREDMIYKYCSSKDEILVEIVNQYFMFDNGIFKTVRSKDISYLDKVSSSVEAYSSYYESYYALSAVMLQYEELLHNINTRDIVQQNYTKRREFIMEIFDGAVKAGEVKAGFEPEELADMLLGIIHICTLNRRMLNKRQSFKDEIMTFTNKLIDQISV